MSRPRKELTPAEAAAQQARRREAGRERQEEHRRSKREYLEILAEVPSNSMKLSGLFFIIRNGNKSQAEAAQAEIERRIAEKE